MSGTGAPVTRYRAVFLDLDGTLVTADRPIDDADRAAVAAARAAGIRVYISTGRSVPGAVRAWRQLLPDTPVFCFNGAVIHDPETCRDLERTDLSGAVVEAILARCAAADLPGLCFTGDEVVAHPHPDPLFQSLVGVMERGGLQWVAGRDALPRSGVSKLWIVAEPEEADAVIRATRGPGCTWERPRIGRTFEPFEGRLISATGMDAMKRRPLDWVAERHAIPLSAMVAVGDHTNDVAAFEAAGLAVAVEGASPEALARAHRVIGRPETGAVAALLRELAGSAAA